MSTPQQIFVFCGCVKYLNSEIFCLCEIIVIFSLIFALISLHSFQISPHIPMSEEHESQVAAGLANLQVNPAPTIQVEVPFSAASDDVSFFIFLSTNWNWIVCFFCFFVNDFMTDEAVCSKWNESLLGVSCCFVIELIRPWRCVGRSDVSLRISPNAANLIFGN